MSEITEKLLALVQEEDADAFGTLHVNHSSGTYFITGTLHTKIENLNSFLQETLASIVSSPVVFSSVKSSPTGLSVSFTDSKAGEKSTSWSNEKESLLDEVNILFMGELPRPALKANPLYKKSNFETFEKVKNIITVIGFYQPIVLDRNLQVIDGNLRLEVADVLLPENLPVVVLDCEGDRADFLRLVLNRSSEFQRWIYDDVDPLVDRLPQAQPLLEPLGFFSNNILPTTFFGNTVIEYTLDEYNSQMKMYSQDIGLAEWAKMMRKQRLEEEELKQQRKAFKPIFDGKTSLFDLKPSEDDFLPTHDAKKAVSDHVEEMKVVAGTITDNYDAKRKAEMEAKGQVWQNSRRTSKKLAADKRASAEAKALDAEIKGTEDE